MRVELSLRPDNKLGTDEEWDFAEEELRKALATQGLEYVESQGEGSFYGPKIDLHMNDSLGRSWQLGTVQLDLQMPKRFGLTYQGDDNAEHTPAMIHRALLGSLERFVGIYLEHTGGDLPLFLAPGAGARPRDLGALRRRRGVPRRRPARARASAPRWTSARRRSGGKIRDAELAKIPYVVVWGERESLDALAVRRRGGEQSTVGWEALLSELQAAAKL